MSYKFLKLIFNIVSVVLVAIGIALLALNSVKLSIRWYGALEIKNLAKNTNTTITKIFDGSESSKATGFDIAFGGNGFKGVFLNQLIIIMLIVFATLLVFRVIFSFIPKLNFANVILGVIACWGLIIVGVLIWFVPAFASLSKSNVDFINSKGDLNYEVLVNKTMTPSIFLSGFLVVIGGIVSFLSLHLRFD